MFKCKVCVEKDNHIASLQAQLRFQQSMLHYEPSPLQHQTTLEMDKILEGSGVEIQDAKPPKVELTIDDKELFTLVPYEQF